ncbi:MAG: nuclear transport factor 2 family protein [Solirubrobacteraceae bacterium]
MDDRRRPTRRTPCPVTSEPRGIVADHINAVNRFDIDAIVATFAADALVNDNHRELGGHQAIRGWVAAEMVGDRVTIEPVEVIDHHGSTVLRGRYDGEYDKNNLPDELIMSNYFSVWNVSALGHRTAGRDARLSV